MRTIPGSDDADILDGDVLAAQGEQPPLQLRLERRAQVSGQRAGKLAFVSMIGLLSSRPPFGRIEPATGPEAFFAPRTRIGFGYWRR